MQKPNPTLMAQMGLLLSATLLAVGCGGSSSSSPTTTTPSCSSLTGMTIPASAIGIPYTGATKGAVITSATLVSASSAASGVEFCEVKGVITPGTESEVVQDLVTGTYTTVTTPDINFIVDLPTAWNGKTLMEGGGGFDGRVGSFDSASEGDMAGYKVPLARGYAVLGSDSGHSSDMQMWNTEATKNFGREAIKKTHDAAQAVIEKYYGKAPTYNYFKGGSQGGHEALIAARFYPYDFDGIIAGYPAYDLEAMHTAAVDEARTLYNARVANSNGYSYSAQAGEAWLSRTLTKAVSAAIMNVCDASDGALDGIVGDPGNATCKAYRDNLLLHTSANPLRCATGAHTATFPSAAWDAETCLSDAQIETLARTTSRYNFNAIAGFTLEGNLKSYGKWPYLDGMWFGEGAMSSDNSTALSTKDVHQEDFGSAYNVVDAFQATMPATGQLNMLTRHSWPASQVPSFDVAAFNASFPTRLETISSEVDTNSVDYAEFAGRGGKIIHFHGAADVSITPYNSVDFYLRMTGQMLTAADASGNLYLGTNPFWGTDDKATNSDTTQRSGVTVTNGVVDNFYSFYLLPGFGHGHGYFKAQVDWLTALENWRENGTAPGNSYVATDAMTTTTYNGVTYGHASLGTRPVCYFPYYPKYTGPTTSPDYTKAANYTCTKLTAYANVK